MYTLYKRKKYTLVESDKKKLNLKRLDLQSF